MGCHLQHAHRGLCIFSLVCSICSLNICIVHGHLVKDGSEFNHQHLHSFDQSIKFAHHVKRDLPVVNSQINTTDISSFSSSESHSTHSVHSFPSESTKYESHVTNFSRILLQRLFEKYGENGMMTFEGLEQLFESIGLKNLESSDDNDAHKNISQGFEKSLAASGKSGGENNTVNLQHHLESHLDERVGAKSNSNATFKDGDTMLCPTSQQVLHSSGLNFQQSLTISEFASICPALIYFLDAHACVNRDHHSHDHCHDDHHSVDHFHDHDGRNKTPSFTSLPASSSTVWGYSFIACLVISAIGLLAVAIIPVINQVIYNHLLHFLVALAIGSLSGDALLHLLPHAVIPHVHSHDESHTNSTDHELEHEIHSRDALSQKRAIWCGLTALAGILLFFIVERLVGFWSARRRTKKDSQKNDSDLSKSSTGLMLGTKTEQRKRLAKLSHHSTTSCEEMVMMVHSNKDVLKLASDAHDEVHQHCEGSAVASESNWGGHSHVTIGHHHSHEVPKSVAAVAWVVIFGDGLHNFADGLAIGSAFANSLTGGLSTSIAVICHELPHELGDFAMLLKAGMSAKKALIYNCVSSLLCILGMVLGISLGNIAFVNPWIFSIIAGMFLYVALVDMLPEMKSVDPREGEHPLIHLGLQLMGMLLGSSIMLIIAIFEDDIHLE